MEFKVGELLEVVDLLRVFPVVDGVQQKALFLWQGDHVVVVGTRVTKGRGKNTRGVRYLWYTLLTRFGVLESGEATSEGFRNHIERH